MPARPRALTRPGQLIRQLLVAPSASVFCFVPSSVPPSGSMQHSKGLIASVVAIGATGSHRRYVILQCALRPISARNRYRDAVADRWYTLAPIQYQRTPATELGIRVALGG